MHKSGRDDGRHVANDSISFGRARRSIARHGPRIALGCGFIVAAAGCGNAGSPSPDAGDGGMGSSNGGADAGLGQGSGSGSSSSTDSGGSSSGAGSMSSSGSSSGSTAGSSTSSSGGNGADGGVGPADGGSPEGSTRGDDAGSTLFPPGTICNSTGHPLTPPATLKHIIIFMFENEDFGAVNGNASAPYMSSMASACGYASMYLDNMFAENLDSLPHYLAVTSGSNCNTGLDESGSGCIVDDGDATTHQLTTTSIFNQVSSWKAYQEGMPSACDESSSGEYACKHNPPAYYSSLTSCAANDVAIAPVTCNASNTKTRCSAPSNAFTDDLANDTLPAYSFVTPNLLNDMHDGTVIQGDNWLYTYLPLVLQSKAYLNGDVAVLVLWDEQNSAEFGAATPNFFVSPYIVAGTVATTPMNHFAVLRATENALGIATYLGCASGMLPDGGSCPAASTADVRAALNF